MFCDGSDGVCTQYCIPETPDGAVGDTCSSTQFCFGFSYNEGGLPRVAAAGYCINSCDYDAETPCSGEAEICMPQEFFDTAQDVCLAGIPQLGLGEDCGPAGLDAGSFCGPLSVCLDLSPIDGPEGLTCQPPCRAAAGSLGELDSPSSNHPDCPASQNGCAAVFQSDDLGLCIP
jgi:hypothetical protein